MNSEEKSDFSDREKLDRAARHQEIQFLKKQQWAVATAGVILFGGFLAAIHYEHMTALDRFLAVMLIVAGVATGWFFLESLQDALITARRALNPDQWSASTRGPRGDLLGLHKAILVATALVVAWVIVFKLH
jgi:hypothetical protein